MNTKKKQRLFLVAIQNRIFTVYADEPEYNVTATDYMKYTPFSLTITHFSNVIFDLKANKPVKWRYHPGDLTPETVRVLQGMSIHLSSIDELKKELIKLFPEQAENRWL